ncbi:ribosome recycling factor [Candidatus Uhrbacteria bacterium]|nr:ribosome recycling factor [Candidatus Uhrbacteria bacterium]
MTLDTYKPEFEKATEFLKRELGTIHTGRATPALVEDVAVEAYGSKMTVQQLASITVSDARTLEVNPWDKTVMKDLERGIRLAQPNLNPVNDGNVLRIPMPQLTEDARRDLARIIGQKVEAAKQSIRQIRDRARAAIIEQERAKAMSEDDRYRLQKKLDDMTEACTAKLRELGEKKVAEVMTV